MQQQQQRCHLSRRVLLVKEPARCCASDKSDDPYSVLLSSAGYAAAFLPVLAHRLHNIERLRGLLPSFGEYSGLVFTSQRAVEAWSEAWAGVSPGTSNEQVWSKGWTGLPHYCVGLATASALNRQLPVKAAPPIELILGAKQSGNAAALADFIVASRSQRPVSSSIQGKPLLYLVGDKTKDTLATLLSRAEIPLGQIQVYETFPCPTLQADIAHILHTEQGGSRFDWTVFFSPSGAKLVLPHISQSAMPKIAAIGPTTRDYLANEINVPIGAMADAPTPEALVEAIQAADTAAS